MTLAITASPAGQQAPAWAKDWVAKALQYQRSTPYPETMAADPTQSEDALVIERKCKVAFFPGRQGYDQDFLGATLPMPTLSAEMQAQAAPLLSHPAEFQLDYTHFSIVQNKERRMPMLTAVNLDGKQYQETEREGKWVLEGRIALEHQMGNEAFVDNPFDKGHMVRRRDASWGELMLQGSNDSCVYTNATLQHADLNQRNWLDLENNVLREAVASQRKMTIFTGPVLRPDDPLFDNQGKMELPTRIPQQFWKVIVWNDARSGLQSRSYLMSQTELGDREASTQRHRTSAIKPFRVPLETISQLTGIDFGPLQEQKAKDPPI